MKTKAEDREDREEQRTVSFLLEASTLYRETCPELARFLMQRPREANEQSVTSHCRRCQLEKRRCRQHHNGEYWVCRYCSQQLQPASQRVRLRPKRRASARVQSVLRRAARGRRLSLAQKEMLRRFRASRCTLMATCHTCNNTSRYSGPSRDYMSPFSRNQSTPGGAASAARRQKTPQSACKTTSASSTPKSLRKDKTPTHTPRASTSSSSGTPASASSSSPSSSSSKVKKWVVQRLSKILVRGDQQGDRRKSSLKDFLCSL